MNYFIQMFTQNHNPLYDLCEASAEHSLSGAAEIDASIALRNQSPLTAWAHQLSSTVLKTAAISTMCHAFAPSSRILQATQDVKHILLLPVGLFGTVSALRKRENLLAFGYFYATVLPGVASLADAYYRVSLLSSGGPSVHRVGDANGTDLLPGDRNYTGF
ncbi:MAG: hypothetical protein JSR46_06820 [Verrucomicrobia bacterium]|nr:hypothetical protein [Verrucomicrobiota bacterium]